MANNTESVNEEIDLHRGSVPERQWLTHVGLIDSPEIPYQFELVRDWHLPGSESYVLDFKINPQEGARKRVLAKACIKIYPVQTVEEWHSRRQRIMLAGIEVPTLYSTHRADYIEEYIEMDLKTAYNAADTETRSKLESRFVETYKKLGQLGFSAVSLHDVRSRGEDIVLIDFGSDLGGYSEDRPVDEHLLERAQMELKRIVKV